MGKRLSLLFILILLAGPILGQVYDPRFEEAKLHFKKGFMAFNQGKYPEAVKEYKDALDLTPSFTKAWYWIGKAYYKLGLMDQALLSWKKFLDLSDDNQGLSRKIESIFAHEYNRRDPKPPVYKHLKTIVGAKWDRGKFYSPTSLAIDNKDNIYLVSAATSSILKFSPTGDFLDEFGKRKLTRPFGIALDKEGNIYVSDFGGDCVKKFDPQGGPVLTIGERGKDDGQFLGPQGITVDGHGNIYVVDSGNTRVQKFDKEGKFLMKFGRIGNYAGCFTHPTDILLSEDNRIWVSDSGNRRIQKFDPSGNFLAEFRPPTELVELRGMVEDGESFLISDARGRVFRFRPHLNQWQTLNLKGKEMGIPIDVATNQHGLLYVADFKNQAIEVFIPPEYLRTNFNVTVDRVITKHYPTIVYCVSVTGKDRIPILGLDSKNFKVLEKGRQMFPIAVKTPLQDKDDLVAIFIVDTSEEMAPYGDDIKRTLFKFIGEMKAGDQAGAVISFSDRVYKPQPVTPNKDKMTYAVGRLSFNRKFRSDALAKAIYQGVTETLNLFGKRVIILLTRGQRKGVKSALLEEVLHYSRNNYVQVMIIDYHEGEKMDDGLKRFAASTNGLYLLAHRSPLILDNLYEEVLDLIRRQTQYLIFYESPGDDFSGRWVDGLVAAGYGQLYGEDLGGYFVP